METSANRGERGRRLIWRMVDPPGGAVRPVEADTIAHLAAEELVARPAEPPGLGAEQRVLDGAQRLGADPARGRPAHAIEFGEDALMGEPRLADHAAGKARNHRPDAGRTEPLVELAPPDDALVGREFYEIVVPPAGVAGERLDARNLHSSLPSRSLAAAAIPCFE